MKYLFSLIIISTMLLNTAVARRSVGEAANVLFYGTNFLTKFFWVACILVGVFLLTGFMVHYKEHRNNPKLVPMSTVITYLILGLIAISIPFLNRIFGDDGYDIANRLSCLSSWSVV
jgi:hypothetical protein